MVTNLNSEDGSDDLSIKILVYSLSLFILESYYYILISGRKLINNCHTGISLPTIYNTLTQF